RQVPAAVGKGFAAGAFDQDGGAAGDPVDASVVGRTLELEADPIADADVKRDGGLLAGCDQVMRDTLVGKDPPRQGMKVLGRAARTTPAQELGQMQQLMLEDSLQGLEPV